MNEFRFGREAAYHRGWPDGAYCGFLRNGRMLGGRVRVKQHYTECRLTVDESSGRFTGASIAGLVVGAMGVFVFTVALRHWLGERRKFREGTRA